MVPFLVISRELDIEALPVMDNRLESALIEKIFEILAVIPELDAISKNVSGVVSPSPNLPNEVDEKMANIELLDRS